MNGFSLLGEFGTVIQNGFTLEVAAPQRICEFRNHSLTMHRYAALTIRVSAGDVCRVLTTRPPRTMRGETVPRL
jgi:hypothetical protein